MKTGLKSRKSDRKSDKIIGMAGLGFERIYSGGGGTCGMSKMN